MSVAPDILEGAVEKAVEAAVVGAGADVSVMITSTFYPEVLLKRVWSSEVKIEEMLVSKLFRYIQASSPDLRAAATLRWKARPRDRAAAR